VIKKTFGTAFLLLFSLSVFAPLSRAQQAVKAGMAAPSVAVKEVDADGLKKLLPQNSGSGKALLINFWATWCGPCREEFPDLVKLNSKLDAKSVDFITISLDDVADITTAVPSFLKSANALMPAYLLNTPEQETAILAVDKNWQGSLPATFLYNSKGELVFKKFGRVDPEELSTEIAKATGKN